jgi:hypothetical protein
MSKPQASDVNIENPDITLVVTRVVNQRTADKVHMKHLIHIGSRALGGSRGSGWTWKVKEPLAPPIETGVTYVYTAVLMFKKISGREGTKERQIGEIIEFAKQACNNSQFGRYKWEVKEVALGNQEVNIETPDETASRTYKEAPLIVNLDRGDLFDHIYDRDSQIDVLLESLRLANDTEFQERHHSVLYGEPGCGKSEILLSVQKMLGVDGVDYLSIDATSTTKAGIEKHILDADILPRVMFIEEIEKVEESGLRYLLGIMDTRGEIRKMNAKIGHRVRQARMVVLATVNNITKFRAMLEGALASRFSDQIFCPRPDRKVLEMILRRDVRRYHFKEAYIEPALAYCFDQHGITDPRKVRTVCLKGREGLLDGSYQKKLDACRDPHAGVDGN